MGFQLLKKRIKQVQNNSTSPLFLCIETSTLNCSVAVFRGEECLSLVEESSSSYIHGEVLHLFMERALDQAGITSGELNAVAVTKGPGSYTGLRIGVSAAKGLCFALKIPLYSVTSTRVLAEAVRGELQSDSDRVLALLDARRMEVYASLFDSQLNQIGDTTAEEVDADTFEDRREGRFILAGDAQPKLKEVFTRVEYVFTDSIYPSAMNMAKPVLRAMEEGLVEDVAYFEPFYLKDFVAGKPRKSPLFD